MSIINDFESWKDFLSNRLEEAKAHGMSEHKIANLALEVGNYLASNVEAENEEEAILKELWNVASEDERLAIAQSMIKLVQNQ